MDAHAKDIILDCTKGSDEGRMPFPEVVAKLMEAGVEHYHADLLRAEKTYYMPDGLSLVAPCHALATAPSKTFQAGGIEAAIRAIQAKTISYEAFCEGIAAAGCIGYLVSLAGRRAVYFGRTGESHVEPFPAAKA